MTEMEMWLCPACGYTYEIPKFSKPGKCPKCGSSQPDQPTGNKISNFAVREITEKLIVRLKTNN